MENIELLCLAILYRSLILSTRYVLIIMKWYLTSMMKHFRGDKERYRVKISSIFAYFLGHILIYI